jgi:hypothetical protein
VLSTPDDTRRIAAAQGSTLFAFVLFALGSAAGLALWR